MEHGPTGNPGELAQQLVGLEHKVVLAHAPIQLQQMVELTVPETPVSHRLVTMVLAQVFKVDFSVLSSLLSVLVLLICS